MTQNAIYTPIIGTGHDDPKTKLRISIENSYTWATKPAASAFGLGEAYFSDIDAIGWSNGTTWRLLSPYTTTYNIGLIVPSLAAGNTATYSQTGTTITVTSTAHSMTALLNGNRCYLVIGSGLASTGWFDNFTYADANSFTVTSTVSQSTSGTVNTNVAETILTPLSANIAGLLTENSTLEATLFLTNNNSAGTKTCRFKLGASTWSNFTTSTVASGLAQKRVVNQNSFSRQFAGPLGGTGVGTSTGISAVYTENTAAATLSHTVTIQLNTASEHWSCQHFQIRIF